MFVREPIEWRDRLYLGAFWLGRVALVAALFAVAAAPIPAHGDGRMVVADCDGGGGGDSG